MQKIIRSRAPVRISFAGGGTDISNYSDIYGGMVVNAAVNRYAYSTLIMRDDDKVILDSLDMDIKLHYKNVNEIKLDGNLDLIKSVILHFKGKHPDFFKIHKGGFEIHTSSEIPPRSGLGSSASMFVSVIGLFNTLGAEYHIDNYEIAELAYYLEREKLKNAGGRQDQYAATFGGLSCTEFKGKDFVKVNPLKIDGEYLLELESNLLLLDLGPRTDSGKIIEDQIKNLGSNSISLEATHKTKFLALELKYALLRGDFEYFGELLDLGWQEKKKFSDRISNEKIDDIYRKLRKLGAIGGKVLGAGGGGHMLVYCKYAKKLHVLRKALELGLKEVPFVFDHKGLTTWSISKVYERQHQGTAGRKYQGEKILS